MDVLTKASFPCKRFLPAQLNRFHVYMEMHQ